ncbi:MAG: ATP-binding protein [Propionibacteriaceae bacterium]|jgi:hypothetical protein|nr:ATP-binding protein [Propionibacteriaceae bacterium]
MEVKSGAGGPPKSLQETVSAFANGDGGLIILGLDEGRGFPPVLVDARRLADTLLSGKGKLKRLRLGRRSVTGGPHRPRGGCHPVLSARSQRTCKNWAIDR